MFELLRLPRRPAQAALGGLLAMTGVSLGILTGLCVSLDAQDSGARFPFYIYREFRSRENHFAPSGWMGDYGDIRFDDHWRPTGSGGAKTVIRIDYTAQSRQQVGWAGIYWQQPANNWGSRPGGLNLNGARKLVFKARGDKGGEMVEEFKVGGIAGDYADSGSAGIGPIVLAKDWKEYQISLDGQELSSIAGGFCWTISRDHNPDGAIFYLDDIRFEGSAIGGGKNL
jgi:hypothetical protein